MRALVSAGRELMPAALVSAGRELMPAALVSAGLHRSAI